MTLSRLREEYRGSLSDLKALLKSPYVSRQMKVAIRKELLRRKTIKKGGKK